MLFSFDPSPYHMERSKAVSWIISTPHHTVFPWYPENLKDLFVACKALSDGPRLLLYLPPLTASLSK